MFWLFFVVVVDFPEKGAKEIAVFVMQTNDCVVNLSVYCQRVWRASQDVLGHGRVYQGMA